TRHSDDSQNITMTESELESIIDTMQEEGVLEKDEAEILQGTFKMKEATAHDIMTHRVDVVFLNVNDTNEEIEKAFSEHLYSRMPVYKGNTDNVVGLLNIKDYFNAKVDGNKVSLSKIMTKPLFTAENTNVDTLIKEMQKAKKHMAVVLDENGGVSGIVTMEDCIETIFGEIYDETDQDEKEPLLEEIRKNEYTLDADMAVDVLFDKLEIENLPDNPYQAVNSFLFELSEDVPEIGRKYTFSTIDEILDDEGNLTEHKINMLFTITEIEGHRVKKVNLKIERIEEKKSGDLLEKLKKND
ncbi:MAG: hemolysin family protein, partial [Clostridia bacterium]|nr:hemolysin family protein [Clostridia bacterium]